MPTDSTSLCSRVRYAIGTKAARTYHLQVFKFQHSLRGHEGETYVASVIRWPIAGLVSTAKSNCQCDLLNLGYNGDKDLGGDLPR